MMNKSVAFKNPYQEEENGEARNKGRRETITVTFFIFLTFVSHELLTSQRDKYIRILKICILLIT